MDTRARLETMKGKEYYLPCRSSCSENLSVLCWATWCPYTQAWSPWHGFYGLDCGHWWTPKPRPYSCDTTNDETHQRHWWMGAWRHGMKALTACSRDRFANFWCHRILFMDHSTNHQQYIKFIMNRRKLVKSIVMPVVWRMATKYTRKQELTSDAVRREFLVIFGCTHFRGLQCTGGYLSSEQVLR